MIRAVVFDLDGVLVQSEELWDQARRELVDECDRAWPDDATRAMMGMSSKEWSTYLHEELDVPLAPEEINRRVLAWVEQRYRERIPWIPGAPEAVARLAARWPLGLATSSNREIIDLVLEVGGLRASVLATVSSEEVAAGKPEPDVYLEAARRLEHDPAACAAVEDSTNGLRAAHAAGMRVVAIPNPAFPPAPEGLELADVVLHTIEDLTPAAVQPD